MKIFTKQSLVLAALAFTIAFAPGITQARGSVHIDLPSVSIGFHDRHDRYHRKKYRHRNNYYHNRYYDHRYYNSRRYYDPYYPKSYRYNRYYDPYYCPTNTYSRYYDRGRDCYRHKDHYHCE